MEIITPNLGSNPRYAKLFQRLWLALGAALVLGLGALGWINRVQVEPRLLAMLMACAMVLAGHHILLSRRLQRVRMQRDKALARFSETEDQISTRLQAKDFRAETHDFRLMQELQSEIADLRARGELLQAQAHHDGLTGLANRRLLADRFHFAAERAKRSGQSFALLMMDLDDFKTVNDNYGHAAGDAVLVTIARRLAGAVRASDTVARLGGDEFVLIIESFEDPQELARLGQKLIDTLSDTITLDTGVIVTVGASLGLALYPDQGSTMDDLLRVADYAMYECKSSGLMTLQ